MAKMSELALDMWSERARPLTVRVRGGLNGVQQLDVGHVVEIYEVLEHDHKP